MEKSTIGIRIKTAREKKGLFQEKLAELIDVTSGKIISNWETGIAKPDADKIVRLCGVLGVSAAYMLDYYHDDKESISDTEYEKIKKYRILDSHGKSLVDQVIEHEYERLLDSISENRENPVKEPTANTAEPPQKRFRRITFYDGAASAGTGQYLDNIPETKIKVPLNECSAQADYILTVSGDSMEPMFSNRDRICVKYQTSVEIGEIGIFILNGDSYVKEYAGNRLVSINPKYKDVIIGKYDNIVCRGKVLGKI